MKDLELKYFTNTYGKNYKIEEVKDMQSKIRYIFYEDSDIEQIKQPKYILLDYNIFYVLCVPIVKTKQKITYKEAFLIKITHDDVIHEIYKGFKNNITYECSNL